MSKLIKSNKDYNSKELKNLPIFGKSTKSVLTSSKNIHNRCSFNDIVSQIKSTPPSYYDNIGIYTKRKIAYTDSLFDNLKDDCSKNIRKLKTKLPYFTFSGFQEQGRNKNSIEYNGCVQIDIDIKSANGESLALQVKECFKNHSYISLCGISPSKHGVKALVFTDNTDKDKHKAVTNFIYTLLLQDCSLLETISKEENIPLESLLDFLPITQPCFSFYDKDVHYVKDIEVLNVGFLHSDYTLELSPYNSKQSQVFISDSEKYDTYSLIQEAGFNASKERDKIRALEKQKNLPKQKTDKSNKNSGIELSPIIKEGKEHIDYIGREISIRATKSAKLQVDKFNSGAHRSIKVFKYASKCNRFGVSLDVAREQVLGFIDWNLESRHIEKVRECYELYSSQFGENKYRLFDKYELPKPEQIIKEGEKLSSVFDTIDLGKNAMFCSPTGSGKTYCIVKKLSAPRILVLPSRGLVESIASDYPEERPSLFYEDAKDIHNDKLIAVTYHSFKNLCEQIDIGDYLVFVDEAHNTTASISWLSEELSQVVELLPRAKGYYLFTATPLISTHPAISSLGVINIEEEKPVKKKFRYLRYKGSRDKAILKRVAKNKAKGVQTFILFNNKNESTGQLGSLLATLKKYKVVCLNADKKAEESYKEVIVRGDASKYDVVISTTVLKEGNSITKHAPEVQFLIVGFFHPCEIEQFSARARGVKHRDVLLLKSDKSEEKESSFLSLTEVKRINERERINLSSYSTILNSKTHNIEEKDNIIEAFNKLQNNCIDVVRDNVNYTASINELKVSGELFKKETTIANSDSIFMLSYLRECYNWNVELCSKEDLQELTSGEIDEETKALIKARSKANKEKEEEFIDVILKDVREVGRDKNIDWLEAYDKKRKYADTKEGKEAKINDTIEYKIRKRIEVISNRINDFETAINIVSEIGHNDRKYAEYFTKFNLDRVKKLIEIKGANSKPLKSIDCISGSGELGKKYTRLDFLNILNKSQDILGLPHYTINDSNLLKRVSYFFDLKRCKVKREGKRVNGYEITSINPSGLSLDNNSGDIGESALRETLEKLYGNDKDLIDVLMKF